MDEQTERDIETFRQWVADTPPGGMVFFGGAGVSTESGIPDFRSPDGLYAQKYPHPPEQMISRSFFDAHPREFFDFYCDRMLALDAQPNQAHRKLAELERVGTLSAVVTQNIDGLHQKAGSSNVLELHGSVLRNYCMECGAAYSVDELLAQRDRADDSVPRCPACSGIVKPDVVLYEEALDERTLQASVDAIARAALLVVAGTSLAVYPAAGLIDFFQGDHLVIVNRTPTPRDRQADLCLAANVGEVFDF
ncbi:NAD-dependent protein deacylase [Gordonibacter massiliensis (ex Traore et al. 2017)]|uniref:protein acetyllysine N-acetyltransferase n=1 Tax=Gordonibacter massiliensis (ex Traore et al. 2017) TaxID=1841863 RepID=A0A842JDX6_9ACTN|nr:NAD-dependent protein deacylase [Gordonibacter massiliensis (ex Traore et al. 2017)]MBC2888178.1 NAD-dependent protein deacylase [Gordonibacter massiliensis (ex Traore et al. 2017)]